MVLRLQWSGSYVQPYWLLEDKKNLFKMFSVWFTDKRQNLKSFSTL